MKVKIVCLGKIKEKYLREGIEEYLKRIKRFSDVEIIELTDEKIPENPSEAQKSIVISKEGDKILKAISKGDYVISLCIEGKQLESREFAKKISDIITFDSSTITFVIGGSLGIDHRVKQISNLKLSFSKMTFPHQLMRLILLEQIYRAFKINNNEEYHK